MTGHCCMSLNHLQNVLFYINVRYHFLFRLHRNSWKTTRFMYCLVNTQKYTIRRNPPVGKLPLVFLYSSICIIIITFIHEMHDTILGLGKYKHCYNILQSNARMTAAQYESCSINSLGMTAGSIANLHSVWITHHTKHTQNHQRATFFSCHYFHNNSTLNTGVFYTDVIKCKKHCP
jgi:hypothetical protein